MASESLEIKIPSFSRIKKNPWVLSTILASALAIAAIIIILTNSASGSLGYCSTSEGSSSLTAQQAGQSVVSFLNSHTNMSVQLKNVTEFSGVYEVDLLYQNQTIPTYSTKDGKYLMQVVTPIQ